MLKLPENITSQTQDFNLKIDAIVVSSQEEYHIAGEYYKLLADMERQIKDFFKPHKENAWKAHKALVEAENDELAKVVSLKNKLSSLMLTFQKAFELEQEKKRLAEQKALEEIEKKKNAEIAKELKAKGLADLAKEIKNREVNVMVKKEELKTDNLSTKKTYKANVIDKMALIKAVAEGRIPIMAVDANMTFLNNQARMLKNELKYDGVEVVEESGITYRR